MEQNKEQQPTIEEVVKKHAHLLVIRVGSYEYAKAVAIDWASIETEQLRRENTELKELPNELSKWINQEIDTAEAKLKTLSPLGKHALQAPIKAQIALLREIAEKFKIKSIQQIKNNDNGK